MPLFLFISCSQICMARVQQHAASLKIDHAAYTFLQKLFKKFFSEQNFVPAFDFCENILPLNQNLGYNNNTNKYISSSYYYFSLFPLLFLTFYFEQLYSGFPTKREGGSGWADAPTLMRKILKNPSFCQMSTHQKN